MADHRFDHARVDLWQRSEAIKSAREMGGVVLDQRHPVGFRTRHPNRSGAIVHTAPKPPNPGMPNA